MSDTANKGGFEALLEEIGELAKAMPTEDAGEDKVEAAAAAAEAGAEEGEGEDEEGEEGGEGKPFGKSYVLKGEDGEEVEAIDGTELVKSLIERIEASDEKVSAAVTGLLGVVKAQGELIKSMGADLNAIKGSAKPRKTVLTVNERPAPKADELAKSHGAAAGGMTGEEFMAKSMTALAKGSITSRDVALSEQLINEGKQPPEHVRRAVAALS